MENEKLFKIYKMTCTDCNKNMFSDYKNDECSSCGKKLTEEPIEIKNYIEKIKPKSLIITKSFGELTPLNYSNSDILHTGISNSKGKVYNFWFNYKIEDESKNIWKQVINIDLDQLNEELKKDEVFDDVLYEDFLDQKVNFPNYDQFNNNCYDYVCRFLNKIKYGNIQWTKQSLAITLIEPTILYFDKFCSLYKQINKQENKFEKPKPILEDVQKVEFTYSVCDICNEMIAVGQRNRCSVCSDYDLCDPCYINFGHGHEMKKF